MNIDEQVIENKTNIENRRLICDEFRESMSNNVNKIWACMDKITNHYAKKPSWTVLVIISFLSSLVVGLIVGVVVSVLG